MTKRSQPQQQNEANLNNETKPISETKRSQFPNQNEANPDSPPSTTRNHRDSTPPSKTKKLGPALTWVWLALAIAWVILARIPLVLNAGTHLDSDLAVDGLTLLDATHGHWRWHYPATPFIGIVPVLLSWPQAMVGGATPITLVSGGVLAYLGLMVATFVMNRRAFGGSVASWGLVPLAFASVGTIWLSGRVTGGHLMAGVWQAGAFALLCNTLKRGGPGRSFGLGIFCGIGLYIDTMFAVSLVGVILTAVLGARPIRRGRAMVCVLLFGLGLGLGVTPRFVGGLV